VARLDACAPGGETDAEAMTGFLALLAGTVTALPARYVPACRAGRLDPLAALKTE
jgi:ABC-type lipoprotein release transport system permease subunit